MRPARSSMPGRESLRKPLRARYVRRVVSETRSRTPPCCATAASIARPRLTSPDGATKPVARRSKTPDSTGLCAASNSSKVIESSFAGGGTAHDLLRLSTRVHAPTLPVGFRQWHPQRCRQLKTLVGLAAVQTLSRLNRVHQGRGRRRRSLVLEPYRRRDCASKSGAGALG